MMITTNTGKNGQGRSGWRAAVLAICALAGILASHPAEAQMTALPKYTVTDLGPLQGGTYSRAYAINSAGQTVGLSSLDTLNRAVLWNGGVPTELEPLPGYLGNSVAYGVNAAGQAVGSSMSLSTSLTRAVLWDGEDAIDLGTLGGNASVAHGINDNGIVVGAARKAYSTKWHAFAWQDVNENGVSDPGEMQQVSPLLSGDAASAALAINKYNVITGWAKSPNGSQPEHAYYYHNGYVKDLGTLGGSHSFGFGINEAGRIVGEAMLSNGSYRAFMWKPHLLYGPGLGSMSDLGTLPGYSNSAAMGINKDGAIVGTASNYARPSYYGERAVRFYDSGPRDLNSMIPSGSGWVLKQAWSINDAGKIVGMGTLNGKMHAFRLNPLFLVYPLP